MKCRDCLIWQRKREDFNIDEQWDNWARCDLRVLAGFAELVPVIRENWKQHELLRDTECPLGRCILNQPQ